MNTVNCIPTIIAASGVLIALLVWRNSKKTLSAQLYLGFVNEYKSKEMLAAIEGLRKFERECTKAGECPDATYEKKKCDLLESLETIEDDLYLNAIENSLHHQRRLVACFYHAIYVAAKNRMILKRDLFGFWSSGALEIIPDILQHITDDPDKHLMDLYKMAKKYEKSKWFRTLDRFRLV